MRELNKSELESVQGGIVAILATAAGAYVGVKAVRWVKKTFF